MPELPSKLQDILADRLPSVTAASEYVVLKAHEALVDGARIGEVAAFVRDSLGYELLTNLTPIDYLAQGEIELVYHFVHVAGGVPLALKVRLARDTPRVPSLAAEWPGAELQEREAFDLYGVEFVGHPNLRRIYMWDELEGFPMRKDYTKHGDKYLSED